MRRIYKYKLEPRGTVLNLPVGHRLLTTHDQHGVVMLWVEADFTVEQTEPVEFVIVGTGHEFDPTDLNYLGTTFLQEYGLVLHVYYRTIS